MRPLHKTPDSPRLQTSVPDFSIIITMDTQQPFPFQKLPTEIRLMVYECIPIQIKRNDFNTVSNTSLNPRFFATVSKYIDQSILLTCRRIHAEAAVIMQRRLEDILATPPRWIVDLSNNVNIHKCGGPLWHISRYLTKRAIKAGKSLGTVPYLGTGMGASGARYHPDSDPDYEKLARMTELWFRSLDHQRQTRNSVPSIEIALTAPEGCPALVTSRAQAQLGRTLFEEHGGFRFVLRRTFDHFPNSANTGGLEMKAIVFGHDTGDVVRAVQGPMIGPDEFAQQWGSGNYY